MLVGPALEDALADLGQERGEPVAVQVHGLVAGVPVVDVDTLAEGCGSLVTLHCASKPLLALAVVAAHVEGRLDMDEPVARMHTVFDRHDKGGLTTRHLLQHRACLADFAEIPRSAFTGRSALVEEILSKPQVLGHPPGKRTHYSVVSNWVLLGEILEHATGTPPPDAVADVLKRLGVEDIHLTLPPQVHGEVSGRLTTWTMRARDEVHVSLPTPELTALPLYGTGGFATARSLASFYSALTSTSDPVLAEAVRLMTATRVRDRDLYTRVAVAFGLGVSVDVQRSWFGKWFSPWSYGASGAHAGTTGVADPAHELALAVLFTDFEAALASYARRRRVVEAVFTDLGLLQQPAVP